MAKISNKEKAIQLLSAAVIAGLFLLMLYLGAE